MLLIECVVLGASLQITATTKIAQPLLLRHISSLILSLMMTLRLERLLIAEADLPIALRSAQSPGDSMRVLCRNLPHAVAVGSVAFITPEMRILFLIHKNPRACAKASPAMHFHMWQLFEMSCRHRRIAIKRNERRRVPPVHKISTPCSLAESV